MIRALKHPEPSTPVRAAEILGELKAKDALPYLIELTKISKDPFIVKAALSSIKKIEDKNFVVKTEQSISKNGIINLQ
ncbi:MAG: HEAT repeat domain-containing protein [Bacteroidetes bacterium]|nr:HEAT repeat domain-containing protein [Bacteroidota bacterium]